MGTDFFTYHMTLGSLHTNPVTVAITVTSREEAERLGAGLSQQQSGGMLFGRGNSSTFDEKGDHGDEGGPSAEYDEESATSPPPPPTNSSSKQAMFRRPSYRDSPSSSVGRKEAPGREDSRSPQRNVEMQLMGSRSGTLQKEESFSNSLRRPDSVGRDDGRKALISGEHSNSAQKLNREASTSSPEALFKGSGSRKK